MSYLPAVSQSAGALDLGAALAPLEFVRLRLHFQVCSPLYLPAYKGSTFRGAFGTAFKRTVCIVRHGECERCLLRSQCVYPYVFDTPVSNGHGIFQGYREAPHPYVIEPPLERRTTYASGEKLAVGLALIGRAIAHIPYFVYVFQRMGDQGLGKARGRAELIGAEALAAGGAWVSVYDGTRLRNDLKSLTVADLPAIPEGCQLTLRLLTPTQIKTDGTFIRSLSFVALVRALLRRLTALSEFHGDHRLDLPFRDLVDRAGKVRTVDQNLRWYEWERYSCRKRQRMRMGGLVGSIVFDGPWREFSALVTLGQHLHLGKGTSFGMGQYVVDGTNDVTT